MWDAVVIGAGPSGLSALKALLQKGLRAIALEKRHDVGGVWLYEEGPGRHSSAYKTLVTITSKTRSAFSDFPFPADAPDYLPYWAVQAYFRRYAEHFGLLTQIRFEQEVTKAQPSSGKWLVETAQGETHESRYLIVASGHHWKPYLPSYPGHFNGESWHAHDYTDPVQLRGRRLLIVGAGNSGADIAVDGARLAKSVDLSIRRGYHILPKFAFFGEATDALYHKLVAPFPRPLRRLLSGMTVRLLTGSPTRYGMPVPKDPIFHTHPLVNSELLYQLRHGKVRLRPSIARLEGDSVLFTDGQRASYDLIIWATGYEVAFPFLAPELVPAGEKVTRLYLHVFHVDEPTLAFVGLIQPNGCLWNLSELQGRLIAAHVAGHYALPTNAAAEAQAYWEAHRRRYAESPRHLLEVDWHEYHRDLRRRLKNVNAYA